MTKNLLLLPGWGANNAIWTPIIPALPQPYQVNYVPIPWENQEIQSISLTPLEHYLAHIADALKSSVHVIAWSMGGLISLRLAQQFPALVKSITFIASVPQFISIEPKQSAINYEWFHDFKRAFQLDPQDTFKKFFALQAKGDHKAKHVIRLLKKLCPVNNYNINECVYGLELLEQDMTEILDSLTCPTFFIHGENDAIVAVEAVESVAQRSVSNLQLIPSVGHAPLLSCPDVVVKIIDENLKNI